MSNDAGPETFTDLSDGERVGVFGFVSLVSGLPRNLTWNVRRGFFEQNPNLLVGPEAPPSLAQRDNLGLLLGNVPLEVALETLRYLSIPDLLALRETCVAARRLVDGMVEWQAIARRSPWIVDCMVRVDARAVTIADLWEALTTTKCFNCPRFGDYIHLLEVKRVCWLCLVGEEEFCPATPPPWGYANWNRTRVAVTQAGFYGNSEGTQNTRFEIIRHSKNAHRHTIAPPVTWSEWYQLQENWPWLQYYLRWMLAVDAPFFSFGGPNADIHYGYFCTICYMEWKAWLQERQDLGLEDDGLYNSRLTRRTAEELILHVSCEHTTEETNAMVRHRAGMVLS